MAVVAAVFASVLPYILVGVEAIFSKLKNMLDMQTKVFLKYFCFVNSNFLTLTKSQKLACAASQKMLGRFS